SERLAKTPPGSFFPKESLTLTAQMTVYNSLAYELEKISSPYPKEAVQFQIKKVQACFQGTIYKMIIPKISIGSSYLKDDRTVVYLYVTSNKVYRLWGYSEESDHTIYFYNDDALLIKTLDTEEKLIKNSYIVFQKIPQSDALQNGAVGEHKVIGVHSNLVLSRYWGMWTPNGDIGFYEDFTWDLSKGLVSYRSGYKAEADIIYLNNIHVEK
ncbi:MAG: hypothetical protein FWC54_06480, partial [Actinomycetia bacterium]|nr:hypothetical protein [Actinomycetes bacterium]